MFHALRCFAAAAGIVLAMQAPARADESSLSCDGGIVSLGDAKVDLLGKCGRPSLQEQSVREGVVLERMNGTPPSAAPNVMQERWTYDFGPNRFMYVAILEDGKVVRIERGGYGYSSDRGGASGSGARCDSSAIRPGDVKLDVLAKCGEPATRDLRQEKRLVPAPDGSRRGAFVTVDVETWTYDFGPRRFMAIVVIEDGKVARVERGGYGYAR